MPYTSGSGRVPALLSCHMTDTLIKTFLKFLKNAIIKEKKIPPKSTATTNDKIANPLASPIERCKRIFCTPPTILTNPDLMDVEHKLAMAKNINDYNFKLPRTTFTKPTTPAITLAPDPPDHLSISTEPIVETNPKIEIPEDLRPFIPPGSNKWYAELRRLRDDHNLQVNTQRRIEEGERKALLLGTSVKRADLRVVESYDEHANDFVN
ncbi:10079_t:CDS:2 [Rhizophagus irregularis]|nr:10079_t:CDS:2 [Rhizophagus irregularis]